MKKKNLFNILFYNNKISKLVGSLFAIYYVTYTLVILFNWNFNLTNITNSNLHILRVIEF